MEAHAVACSFRGIRRRQFVLYPLAEIPELLSSKPGHPATHKSDRGEAPVLSILVAACSEHFVVTDLQPHRWPHTLSPAAGESAF